MNVNSMSTKSCRRNRSEIGAASEGLAPATTRTKRNHTAVVVLVVVGLLVMPMKGSPAEEGSVEGNYVTQRKGASEGLDSVQSDGASPSEARSAEVFSGLVGGISVDPLSGEALARIPVKLPPGRNGMTPELSIGYASNAGFSTFGVGWGLQLGCIARSTTKGAPWLVTGNHYSPPSGQSALDLRGYSDDVGFTLRLQGTQISLATQLGSCGSGCTQWVPSSEEQWIDARFYADPQTGMNHWVVRDSAGLTYTYGTSASARVGESVNDPRGTFRWALEEIRDPNDNTIRFTYAPHYIDHASGSPVYNTYAYPVRIDYGGNDFASSGGTVLQDIFHVGFEYSYYDDQVGVGVDPATELDVDSPWYSLSYLAGSAERISLLTTKIKIWVDHPYGESGSPDSSTEANPSWEYQLDYGYGRGDRYVLKDVALEDFSGDPPPASTFDYTLGSSGFDSDEELAFLNQGGSEAQPISGCNHWIGGASDEFTLRATCASLDIHITGPPMTHHKRIGRTMSGFQDIDGDGVPEFVDGLEGFDLSADVHSGTGFRIYRMQADGTYRKDSTLWHATTNGYETGSPGTIAGLSNMLRDMTGDGFTDIVRGLTYDPNSTNCIAPNTCDWEVSSCVGNSDENECVLKWGGVPGGYLKYFLPGPTLMRFPNFHAAPSALADLNGDGKPDLLECCGWAERPERSFNSSYILYDPSCGSQWTDYVGDEEWHLDIPQGYPLCRFYQNGFTEGSVASFDNPMRWFVPFLDGNINGFSSAQKTALNHTASRNASGDYRWVHNEHKGLRDLNGDGLPDFVWVPAYSDAEPESTGVWHVWFNTGAGFVGRDGKVHDAPGWVPLDAEPYIWRVPQYVRPYNSASSDVLANLPIQMTVRDHEQYSWAMTDLRDMNGDGLLDLVTLYHPSSTTYDESGSDPLHGGSWKVYLNTGHSFDNGHYYGGVIHDAASVWEQTTPTPIELPFRIPISMTRKIHGGAVAGAWHDDDADQVIMEMLDLNNDGIQDYLWRHKTSGKFFVRYGLGGRSNILATVANGLGATWHLDFQSSSSVGDRVPVPTWTASSLIIDSGYTPLAGNLLETRYEFRDGHFDYAAKRFRGFRTSIASTPGAGNTTIRSTTRQYHTAPYDPADPSLHELTSRTLKLVREFVEAGIADGVGGRSETLLGWDAIPITWDPPGASGPRMQIHRSIETSTSFTPLASGLDLTLTTSFDSYDEYNNLQSSTKTGSLILDESLEETVEYKIDPNCHSLPARQYAKSIDATGPATLTIDYFEYDAKCNQTVLGSYYEPYGVEPTLSSPQIPTETTEYDVSIDAGKAGMPTRRIDGNGNATQLLYDCVGFDNHALYPCEVLNAKGHSTRLRYSVAFGEILETTDPNNRTITYVLDRMGRISEEHKPLDTNPFRKIDYEYGSIGPITPGSVAAWAREPDASSGYRREVSFHDSLGRPLLKRTERRVGSQPEVTISDAVVFDMLGRVGRRVARHKATSGTVDTYQAVDATLPGTDYEYDAFDREIEEILPDGNSTVTEYDSPLAGIRVTKDANYVACGGQTTGGPPDASCPGERTNVSVDELGREVLVQTMEGDLRIIRAIVTEYDVLDRRLSVEILDEDLIETGNSKVSYEYDSLGRQTLLDDPDSGIWRYEYDAAGNKIFEDTPKLFDGMAYCFDEVNRVLRRQYVASDALVGDPCSTGATRVSYFYDFGTEGIGRLGVTTVFDPLSVDPTAIESLEANVYDERGRIRKVTKTYGFSSEPEREYVVEFDYDEADRIVGVTYPGDTAASNAYREKLSQSFDEWGQLAAIWSDRTLYVSGADFDRFARPLRLDLGNGLARTWEYSPNASENFELQAIALETAGGDLSKLSYSLYDRVGRPLAIDDLSGGYGTQALGLTNTWAYSYDGIGRLRLASHVASATDQDFDYDFLGNMSTGDVFARNDLSQTPVQYTFQRDPVRPHQIADIVEGAFPLGGMSYESDGLGGSGNGGLTSRPDIDASNGIANVEYNADRKPARIELLSGNVEFDFYYSADGVLVGYAVDGAAPLIFDKYYSVDDTEITRNIFVGNEVFAYSSFSSIPGKVCRLKRGAYLCKTKLRNGVKPDDRGGAGWTYPPTQLDAKGREVTTAATVSWFPPVAAGAGIYRRISWSFDDKKELCATTPSGGGTNIALSAGIYSHSEIIQPADRKSRGKLKNVPTYGFNNFSLTLTSVDAETGGSCQTSTRVGVRLVYQALGTPVTPQGVSFPHRDHLGSTLLLTDHEGSILEHYRYGPYGQSSAYTRDQASGEWQRGITPTYTRDLFTGQRYLWEAQIYDYGARLYDPMLARFMTHDPARQFINPYSYVAWQPTIANDPTGEIIQFIFPALVYSYRAYTLATTIQAVGVSLEALAAAGTLAEMSSAGADLLAAAALGRVPGARGAARAGAKVARAGRNAAPRLTSAGKNLAKSVGNAPKTTTVQRWMSRAELENTRNTGFFRGGRGGTHYATDAANSNPLRARQRLSLDHTPAVRVELEVPAGRFSQPSRVARLIENGRVTMPGGGRERTAIGDLPARVIRVYE